MEVAKGSYREDLKQYFRSKMEANVARYYNFVSIKWIYEPQEFEFYKIKRGSRFYKPDFYLPDMDVYIEIKSWVRPQDKTRLRRFKRYYPEEFKKLWFVIYDKYSRSVANGKIIKFLVGELGIDFNTIRIGSYKEIEKYGKLIPGWE